jgi:hypothetical protein
VLFGGECEIDGEKPEEPLSLFVSRLIRQPQRLLGMLFQQPHEHSHTCTPQRAANVVCILRRVNCAERELHPNVMQQLQSRHAASRYREFLCRPVSWHIA